MINLLPPEIKQDIKFGQLNVLAIRYILIIAFSISVIVGLMFFSKLTLTNSKNNLDMSLQADRVRAAELQTINDDAQLLSETVDTIGSILNQEVKFSILLREIGSVMPPGSKLSSLSLSTDATQPVRLTASLDSIEKVGVLQQNLIESRLFVGADIINVNSVEMNSNYPISGELEAYYNPLVPLNSLDDPVVTGDSL